MEATVSEERSDFGDEVERERAREIAAERGRKRGSGKKTEAQDKVNRAVFPFRPAKTFFWGEKLLEFSVGSILRCIVTGLWSCAFCVHAVLPGAGHVQLARVSCVGVSPWQVDSA